MYFNYFTATLLVSTLAAGCHTRLPPGILSQAASLLFSGPALQRPPAFEVQLSCFEVCGANCFDLLAEGEKLVVRESSSTKVEVRWWWCLKNTVSFFRWRVHPFSLECIVEVVVVRPQSSCSGFSTVGRSAYVLNMGMCR